MKKKNKTIKKLGIVALVVMMFLSASAWLTSRQTAAGVNKIKAGEASIRFANQANAITLTGNDSIPMTKDYAIANLTPYVFDIENDGSIALDYKISISEENYSSSFPDGKVNVVIAKINDVAEASTALAAASVQKVAKNQVIDTNNDFVAHASQKYALIAYIDEATVNNDYLTKSITFKLEVNAVQAGVSASAPAIEGLTTDVRLMNNDVGNWVKFRVKSATFKNSSGENAAMTARFTSFKVNDNEVVGSGYFLVTPTGSVGLEPKYGAEGAVLSNPNYVVEGTNTYSFVFDGVTYNGTFEYTPA